MANTFLGAPSNSIKNVWYATATPTTTTAAANSTTEEAATITVTGAAVGDIVMVSHDGAPATIGVTGYVKSANTVKLLYTNATAAGVTITVANKTIRAVVFDVT